MASRKGEILRSDAERETGKPIREKQPVAPHMIRRAEWILDWDIKRDQDIDERGSTT